MTQNERILRHLRDYGTITSLEAMQEYGVMRLASRVSDLKRMGYEITRTMVEGKNRYGEATHFACYHFVPMSYEDFNRDNAARDADI